jgi:hypothetical protein
LRLAPGVSRHCPASWSGVRNSTIGRKPGRVHSTRLGPSVVRPRGGRGERQLAAEIELTPVSLSDVDLFSEWERDLGWDIWFTQLSAGTNEIRFDHFALPGLLVGRFRSKQSMESVFAVPDGMVVFTIPRARKPLVWSGQRLPPTLMGVVRAGRENCAVLPAGWDCYEFMVSEDLIRRTEVFPPHFLAETTRLARAYLPLVERTTGRFLEQLDSFFHVDEGVDKLPGTVVPRARFFECLIEGLHQVFAGLVGPPKNS